MHLAFPEYLDLLKLNVLTFRRATWFIDGFQIRESFALFIIYLELITLLVMAEELLTWGQGEFTFWVAFLGGLCECGRQLWWPGCGCHAAAVPARRRQIDITRRSLTHSSHSLRYQVLVDVCICFTDAYRNCYLSVSWGLILVITCTSTNVR